MKTFDIALLLVSAPEPIDEAEDVWDALEKSHYQLEGKVVLWLDGVQLPFRLVYDFTDLIDNFLDVLEYVCEEHREEGIFGFDQNGAFDGDWRLRWDDQMLEIAFDWRSCAPPGLVSDLPLKIRVKGSDFLLAWSRFFRGILSLIAPIRLKHPDEKSRIEAFIQKVEP